MNGNRGKQNTPRKRRKNQQGFTLIEVIVALTITGFLLGGLFSLVGGSKQLSWRSEEALVRAIQQRAAWNFALLDNEYADLEAILDDDYYEVRELDDIEAPDRQTQSLQYTHCAHSNLCRRTVTSKRLRPAGYVCSQARVDYESRHATI